MTYLLDVSVLLALGYREHVHSARAGRWLKELTERDTPVALATCPITELGFVRVACGSAGFATDVRSAQNDLKRLQRQQQFIFVDDTLGAADLPSWAEKSKQVTDGHLLRLAALNHGQFATLDTGVPGALLIPECLKDGPSLVRERSAPYGAKRWVPLRVGVRHQIIQ